MTSSVYRRLDPLAPYVAPRSKTDAEHCGYVDDSTPIGMPRDLPSDVTAELRALQRIAAHEGQTAALIDAARTIARLRSQLGEREPFRPAVFPEGGR